MELRRTHPAWLAAAGTFAGYALVLTVLFIFLFVVPYLLFPGYVRPGQE